LSEQRCGRAQGLGLAFELVSDVDEAIGHLEE
jgi:hypothetical protein